MRNFRLLKMENQKFSHVFILYMWLNEYELFPFLISELSYSYSASITEKVSYYQ